MRDKCASARLHAVGRRSQLSKIQLSAGALLLTSNAGGLLLLLALLPSATRWLAQAPASRTASTTLASLFVCLHVTSLDVFILVYSLLTIKAEKVTRWREELPSFSARAALSALPILSTSGKLSQLSEFQISSDFEVQGLECTNSEIEEHQ